MKNLSAVLCLLALPLGATEPKAAPVVKALGVPGAPITLEVFSDFQCPSCKALHEETLRPLVTDYVNKGKVYLIHRDFPLAMHAYSRTAALYANAAFRVNKYEMVATALFHQQAMWAANGKVEDAVASVLSPAELQKVRALIKDPRLTMEIEQDIALGGKAKVHQTPTMVFHHK